MGCDLGSLHCNQLPEYLSPLAFSVFSHRRESRQFFIKTTQTASILPMKPFPIYNVAALRSMWWLNNNPWGIYKSGYRNGSRVNAVVGFQKSFLNKNFGHFKHGLPPSEINSQANFLHKVQSDSWIELIDFTKKLHSETFQLGKVSTLCTVRFL